MIQFTRTLLAAALVVAVFVAPALSMNDDHGDMAKGVSSTMDGMGEKADHATMDATMKTAEGEDAAPAMDAHDHEGMVEKAGASVGIEEKLGNQLADVDMLDSEGNRVNLLELTRDIPTIIIPIYYRCPDVCNILQGSFAQILPDVALKPGDEIQIISVSFDPREGPKDAARAKKTYLAATRGMYPAEHWKFLTGDGPAVNAWLDSIGYTVKREGGLYAHPVAVVAVAPGGKVVRYLYGSSFLPFDITMAGTEAATGKPGLSIKRLLSVCYSYDPEGRRYVFDILRVSGFSIVGFIGLFVLYLVLSGRKERKKKGS